MPVSWVSRWTSERRTDQVPVLVRVQIRDESRMLRPYNMATRAAPFDKLQVADIGDVPINTFDLKKSVDIITEHYRSIFAHGAIPLTLGGDHTLTWPILRAVKEHHGPVALIHVGRPFGHQRTHVRREGCPWLPVPPCL